MLQIVSAYILLAGFVKATDNPQKVPTSDRVPIAMLTTSEDNMIYYMALIERRHFLEKRTDPICSGVIIGLKLILSVCMDCLRTKDVRFSEKEIRVSIPPYHETRKHFHYHSVKKIYRHPECVDIGGLFRMVNNIGLIYLEKAIHAIKPKQFAWLPRSSFNVGAWMGYVRLTNIQSTNIADLEPREMVWDIKTFPAFYALCLKLLNITSGCNSFMCMGYHHQGRTSCNYDHGSALAYETRNKEFVVVGLLSLKVACGAPHSMASFTQTLLHEKWIRDMARVLKEKVEFSYGYKRHR